MEEFDKKEEPNRFVYIMKKIDSNAHNIYEYLICKTHKKPFHNFCENCKENLCDNCLDRHKEHKIISFENLNTEEMKNNLKDIVTKIQEDSNKFINELNNF